MSVPAGKNDTKYPELLPGSVSRVIVPDPDPAKSERTYK